MPGSVEEDNLFKPIRPALKNEKIFDFPSSTTPHIRYRGELRIDLPLMRKTSFILAPNVAKEAIFVASSMKDKRGKVVFYFPEQAWRHLDKIEEAVFLLPLSINAKMSKI
jgi:hypothetical protein